MTPLRVCFATPGVWPLLHGEPPVYGGSELRALAFLRGLAAQPEWDVSLIVHDDVCGKAPGIDVALVADRYHGGRRHLAERLRDRLSAHLVVAEPPVTAAEARAWQTADAALYVTFGVGDYAARLAAWCRRFGRRLTLVAGSDGDFDAAYRPGAAGQNPYGSRNDLCHFALTAADAVVCQTRDQALLLRERFGRSGVVVRNPIELGSPRQGSRRGALWLGKTDAVKRPELFCDLARLCPEVPCLLVANPTDPARFAALRDVKPDNLELRERIPRAALDAALADALCLVNTSLFEGFPNAFLDAGRQAVPVLSLAVDPDGVLGASGGGFVAGGDLPALAAQLRHLHADPQLARAAGCRWRHYVMANHNAASQIDLFADALQRLVRG